MAGTTFQQSDGDGPAVAGAASFRVLAATAQQDFATWLNAFIQVATPDSPQYRRWLAGQRRLVEDQLHCLKPVQAACSSPVPLARWLTDQLQALGQCRRALIEDHAPDDHDAGLPRPWAAGSLVARQAVLGGIALFDCLPGGPAQIALAALAARLSAGDGHYLAWRRQQPAQHMPWRRQALLQLPFDGQAWAALAEGARHMAEVHRASCAAALA